MTVNRNSDRHSLAQWLMLSVVLIIAATVPAFAAKFSFGGNDSKPLSVEEAYQASAVVTSPDAITVTFDIADGYYLYRDKTALVTSTPGVELSAPNFPEAIVIDDEFFGETATYREQVEIAVPFSADDSLDSIEATVKFQGCADIGLCYPPTEYPLQIKLPSTQSATQPASAASSTKAGTVKQLLAQDTSAANTQSSGLSSLSSKTRANLDLFGIDEEPILPPEQAFLPSASVDGDVVTVKWFIEPAYYLYRDKMAFNFADDAGSISDVSFSEALIESDEFFGDVSVFRDQATVTLATNAVKSGNATLNIKYQGCADIGVCFPPTDTSVPVKLVKTAGTSKQTAGTAAVASTAVAATVATQSANLPAISTQTAANQTAANQTVAAQATASQSAVPQSEQDRIRAKLSSSSLWINAASFFLLGLLLSFTPCVFPMIPILSSLILGQGKSLSTGKAFGLSLTYVLSMAVTYTLVGVFIGLSGYNLQAWFQNPWILSVFALIFVLLSLSMFGFYEIQMPQSIQTKLSNWSNKQEGGNWIGVAIMGVLSALIVGPCVTAPLVGALIYIAETGDATVGGVALFSMSMGMGLPLLIIGTSAGKLMPKAGAWMDITKVLFGLSMLAMAIWMLSRFVPGSVTIMLSAALAIFGGVYLATTSRFGNAISWLSRGLGLIITLYGVALMIGLLSGNNSLITPLAKLGSGAAAQHQEIEFERIKTTADLDAVLGEAADAGQYVLLDYYADWCVSCKEMEAYTFTDPAVQASLENVRLIQADVTKNDKEDQAMLKRFRLFGPPAILFFAPGEAEKTNARVVGFVKAERFNAHLQAVLN